MTAIVEVVQRVQEGSDNWLIGQIGVPRYGFSRHVLLTQGDITGLITLEVFERGVATPVYSTTFSKTLNQDGNLEVVHTATTDRWDADEIGHNFAYQLREADVGAGVLKGGRRYKCVFTFPTADDGNVPAVFILLPDALP